MKPFHSQALRNAAEEAAKTRKYIMKEKTINIPVKRYEELLDIELKMICLEKHGVDNWTWYDDAVKEYWDIKEKEESNEGD